MVSSDEPVALDTATSVRRRLAPDIAKVAGATDMSCRSEAWRGGGGEVLVRRWRGVVCIGVPKSLFSTWISEERAESRTPATAARTSPRAGAVKSAGDRPARVKLKPTTMGCAAVFAYACVPTRRSVHMPVDVQQTTIVVPGG